MDLEGIMLSEINQTEIDKYQMISHVWNIKNKTNIAKKKQTHRYREQTGGCQRESGWRMSEIGEGGTNLPLQKNKPQGCNTQHREYI